MRGSIIHERLTGPASPSQIMSMEEIVRPFGEKRCGLTLADSVADGERRTDIPYDELADRTASAAARLRELGVKPGDLVAAAITNDLPSVIAALATWAAGATVVSLPPAAQRGQALHAQRFGKALEAMGCAFVLGDADLVEAGSSAAIRVISKDALTERDSRSPALPDVAVPDIALIQFTSGSVAAPKGVMISSHALAGHVASIAAEARLDPETDRIVSWLPLYHDMGLVAMFLTGLAARTDVVLSSPASFATRPASWLTLLAREKATMSAAPNFAYRLAAAARYEPGLDLSRMRVCISGGERLDWQALLDFHATAAPMGFDWGAIVPSYGLAEGTVAVTYTPLGRGPVRGPGGYVSAGRPMAGVQVEAPAGPELGPIRFRSDWLFSGYHADGALRPVVPGEWFDTGDAGFVHEGELYVSGRRDEVLTTGGRNVFAEDVETVAHDVGGQRIRCCAAFRTQTDSERLALMIEANPRLVKGLEAARELAAAVQGRVATTLGTRLRPVLVVRTGAIPRTSSGKVQRGQCRALYGDGRLAHRLITALG